MLLLLLYRFKAWKLMNSVALSSQKTDIMYTFGNFDILGFSFRAKKFLPHLLYFSVYNMCVQLFLLFFSPFSSSSISFTSISSSISFCPNFLSQGGRGKCCVFTSLSFYKILPPWRKGLCHIIPRIWEG